MSAVQKPSTDAPEIIFVTGFHRSGTTVLAESLMKASNGVGLTVEDLARYLAPLRELLSETADPSSPLDRGVDQRRIEPTLPEEYGWYLHARGGRDFRFRPQQTADLAALVDELTANASPAVLKNPWDTTRESLLLASFPTSRVVIVRRTLSDIEKSGYQALARLASSDRYLRALMNDARSTMTVIEMSRRPILHSVMSWINRWSIRLKALRLLRTVRNLPLDRVAFVSYDEFMRDPLNAATWAGHIVDQDHLAEAFRLSWVSNSAVSDKRSAWSSRVIDRMWDKEWKRLRELQVKKTIISPADDSSPSS